MAAVMLMLIPHKLGSNLKCADYHEINGPVAEVFLILF